MGVPLRNLNMFNELCGRGNLRNIVLVTTMWDEVSEDVGLWREKELQSDFWQWMTRLGSTTHRFLLTEESARNIIGTISGSLPDERRLPQIQREVVDENKPLHGTPEGKSVPRSLPDDFSYFKVIPGHRREVSKGSEDSQDPLPLPPGRHHIPRLPSSCSISSHASDSSTTILPPSEIAIDEDGVIPCDTLYVNSHIDPSHQVACCSSRPQAADGNPTIFLSVSDVSNAKTGLCTPSLVVNETSLPRNETQSRLFGVSSSVKPSSLSPNSLHQHVASLDIPTNFRQNDTANEQPGLASPMGEIAIDENDIIIAFVSISICRFQP